MSGICQLTLLLCGTHLARLALPEGVGKTDGRATVPAGKAASDRRPTNLQTWLSRPSKHRRFPDFPNGLPEKLD